MNSRSSSPVQTQEGIFWLDIGSFCTWIWSTTHRIAGFQWIASRIPRAAEGVKAPADWLEAGDAVRAIEGYRALWKKTPKDPNIAEPRLNSIGYYLLEEKKPAEAIALFKLNVEFHPDSWNAYDSLAEGYVKNGEKALAIKSYEKSLAINPKNVNGAKKLEELRRLPRP